MPTAGTLPLTTSPVRCRRARGSERRWRGEPQGEAISFTTDGSDFITTSEGTNQALAQWGVAGKQTPAGDSGDDSGGGLSLPDFNLANLMGGIYATGIIGVLLLIVGIVGIMRFRRRQRAQGDPEDEEADRDSGVDEYEADDDYDRPNPAGSPLLYPPPPTPVPLSESGRGTTYGSSAGGVGSTSNQRVVLEVPAPFTADRECPGPNRPREELCMARAAPMTPTRSRGGLAPCTDQARRSIAD